MSFEHDTMSGMRTSGTEMSRKGFDKHKDYRLRKIVLLPILDRAVIKFAKPDGKVIHSQNAMQRMQKLHEDLGSIDITKEHVKETKLHPFKNRREYKDHSNGFERRRFRVARAALVGVVLGGGATVANDGEVPVIGIKVAGHSAPSTAVPTPGFEIPTVQPTGAAPNPQPSFVTPKPTATVMPKPPAAETPAITFHTKDNGIKCTGPFEAVTVTAKDRGSALRAMERELHQPFTKIPSAHALEFVKELNEFNGRDAGSVQIIDQLPVDSIFEAPTICTGLNK